VCMYPKAEEDAGVTDLEVEAAAPVAVEPPPVELEPPAPAAVAAAAPVVVEPPATRTPP